MNASLRPRRAAGAAPLPVAHGARAAPLPPAPFARLTLCAVCAVVIVCAVCPGVRAPRHGNIWKDNKGCTDRAENRRLMSRAHSKITEFVRDTRAAKKKKRAIVMLFGESGARFNMASGDEGTIVPDRWR